jgi:L,D-transpeptidase catalytic domain
MHGTVPFGTVTASRRRRVALVAGGALFVSAIVIAAAAGLHYRASAASSTKFEVVLVAPEPAPLVRLHGLAARLAGVRVALHARPGGRVLARLGTRTEFGSPQTVAVVFRKGRWLAVRSSKLGNSRLGWVDADASRVRLVPRPVSIEVDLSRRELTVRDDEQVVRRISVAVGAPDTPTPSGRFYVTDKLPGSQFGSFYGCCILALSGRQPNLPEGWSGGDRLAIHGAPTPTSGTAVSNGCLHAAEADLRYLMKTVELGTEVQIHA